MTDQYEEKYFCCPHCGSEEIRIAGSDVGDIKLIAARNGQPARVEYDSRTIEYDVAFCAACREDLKLPEWACSVIYDNDEKSGNYDKIRLPGAVAAND